VAVIQAVAVVAVIRAAVVAVIQAVAARASTRFVFCEATEMGGSMPPVPSTDVWGILVAFHQEPELLLADQERRSSNWCSPRWKRRWSTASYARSENWARYSTCRAQRTGMPLSKPINVGQPAEHRFRNDLSVSFLRQRHRRPAWTSLSKRVVRS
jgi:hypothetical protein